MTVPPDSPRDAPAAATGADRPAERVGVSELKLNAFRNYDTLFTGFDHCPVVLSGANGAGKTNLLEALSFLSPGRGLRRAALEAVARRPGNGTWAVAATVERAAGPVAIGTGIALAAGGPEKRRSFRIEHGPARSADVLLDYVNVIWLTPAMDGLFTGGSADRRRFVDRAVLAIDRRHARRVNAYEKAVRGRNRLLSEGAYDRAWAAALENEIAELGVAVAAARREWCDLTMALIAENHDEGPFPSAELRLEGFLEPRFGENSAGQLEESYREQLAADRPRDTAAGRTLTGPHRSDLVVRHGARDAEAATCSTGEQKALLIGMVLAQARLVTRLSGATPVVLLDEVAAHLDQLRRSALFEMLHDLGCQSFMTGTDSAVFAELDARALHCTVEDGKVHPVARG
ncbi:MAG: DNA replication/repair protein RecF [Alphaproteobacteria bacterium]